MKFIHILLIGLTAILFGCASNGSNFFISNYEKEDVMLKYTYYGKGEFADALGFDHAPCNYVLISKQILDEKILKNYPFKNTKKYFDTLFVDQLDSLTFQFQLPKNSTVLIKPIHNYGDNIETLVFNGDIILTLTPEIKQQMIDDALMVDKISLNKEDYILVNLKIDELKYVWFNIFMEFKEKESQN